MLQMVLDYFIICVLMFLGAFVFAILYVKCAESVVMRDMVNRANRIKIFPEKIPQGVIIVEPELSGEYENAQDAIPV